MATILDDSGEKMVGDSDQVHSKIFSMIMEVVYLALLMIAVPLIVALDAVVLEHGVQEISVTELTQGGLLLLSTVLMGLTAWKHPDSRGFLVLVTGLLATMFIRENDKFLDVISHGFWIYPAVIVAVGAIACSLYLRDTVIEPMLRLCATKSFNYLVIGLLLLLVFSRAFGTSQLWSAVMGEDYRQLYKAIIQEGIELLGYALLFTGCVRVYLYGRHRRH